ncbi:hypothetical protein AAA799E16_00999 [Marine Group I thaumarchaeote SCGC AAA799-E16]|uniref:Uncharacterized protein n=3 Tax=Marine Group I TaxID=905826 RepID=A0A087RSX0_9ARCH|nr:hypothetical protein AAA799E16_00999 [Marine Group I thaumarchaeote SCGC AAA799-E16]KFM16574.1 hypothetical protein AAA799D11_00616 [Marine Group I thaumarchaeote SCGC AAA799-D11]KFM18524.1 hypothetical protein SCCGRSA3_01059 [Marine Group I thaumarchaeote SCGC RSA3]
MLRGYSILDHDYRNDEQIKSIIENSKNKGIQTHVWKKSEIENYLLIPSLVHRLVNDQLNSSGKSVSLDEIKSILFDSAGELKQDVIAQYAEKLEHWARKNSQQMDTSTAVKTALGKIDSIWDDFDKRLSITPGKDILKKFNQNIFSKYGVSIGIMALSSHVQEDELDDEIKQVFAELSRL